MTFQQLENLEEKNKKHICIFGAGKIGKAWAYDLLVSVGFEVACYCDNKIPAGTEIRDGIRTISFDYLCNEKENYLVFVAMNEKAQNEIRIQFSQNGITDYIMMGFLFLQEFYESVIDTNDKRLFERYKAIIDDEQFLKQQFVVHTGYELNLNEPKTFNEKLQWLKLNDHNPEYIKYVDKCEFKKQIEKKIGREYVVPTLGVWDKPEDIEWDKLPNQFVLKCNHDSGSTIICKDKKSIDIKKVEKKLKEDIKRNFYYYTREWPYKHITPQIIAEDFLADELKDYKFFCFDGKPKIVLTVSGGHEDERKTVRRMYNEQWERYNAGLHGKENELTSEPKPALFEEMLRVATKLSTGIKHVRVDLYMVNGHIYVGELTFYHMSGYEKFKPEEYDRVFGDFIELNN